MLYHACLNMSSIILKFCKNRKKIIYLKQIFYNYFVNLASCTNSSLTNKKIEDTYKVYERLNCIFEKETRTEELERFIRYENVASTIIYLIHPKFFSPQKFREKTLSRNLWTYTFRPDFFILTFAILLHFDFIASGYISLKKLLGKGC